MHQSFVTFCARRRRFFFLKLIVACFFIGTLLIWTRVKKNDDLRPPVAKPGPALAHVGNYEKADNLMEVDIQNRRLQNQNHAEKQEYRQLAPPPGEETLKSLRERVLSENSDEFLVPVLKEVKFEEVDLDKRRAVVNDDYDSEIEEDLKKVKPELGAGGDKAALPDYQEDVGNSIMKKEAFNRLLSDYISPNRSVPDTREKGCASVKYDEDLPTSSVIIIFTNEAFSSLVRTLHSVINRTPSRILSEIILVDDYSDHRDLRGKLERYIATKFPQGKIRLVRLKARAGLIRARMVGAHLAVGDVLIFLDAHCEAIVDWAEPLLQRIKEERTAVVCPIIDVIDDKTLEYYHSNGEFFQIGGFTWSGHFTWINIPHYETRRKAKHYSPTRSPTMAGGLFAIDRKYFWEIGSYDSGMKLWGGENLEMSFRIWQCGGSVEIIPCSRVGHIFRSFHPYSFPGNIDSHGLNTARLAEVWMDEYKDFFYAHRGELRTAEYGDVSDRIAFRHKKDCKSFTWYLDNIYKEKFRMDFDSKVFGQFRNEHTKQCFDNMQKSDSEEYRLSVYPCHRVLFTSQTFYVSNKGQLRRENECASVGSGNSVQMIQCENALKSDTWEYKGSKLISKRSGKCVEVKKNDSGYEITLEECNGNPNQLWVVDRLKGSE